MKPFLVENANGTIYRIVELGEKITKEHIAPILEKLPISFSLRKNTSLSSDTLNEPLEVYARARVIYIYPPRHRMIACTHFDSWNSHEIVSKMHVDNVMDVETMEQIVGNSQIRSCVHFDPKIFGIENYPGNAKGEEIEVDLFVYPESKEREPKLKTLSFGKHNIRSLLEMIAGGDKSLTTKQFAIWRELIMYAALSMKANYEHPDVPEDYNVRLYYKECWQKIDEAGNDPKKMVDALEYLRISIQHE